MALAGELRQAQSQTLTLAPQMRQSLRLLALSLPELRAEIYAEMARNPVIDDLEQTLERATVSQKEREAAAEEQLQTSDDPDDDALPDPSYSADADALERRQRFFDSQTREETLEEHLLGQLELAGFDARERSVAELLIGELDDKGYFAGALADIAQVTGESQEMVRDVLARLP